MEPNQTRTFDWVSRHDERSRAFPVSAVLSAVGPGAKRMWRGGRYRTDQGREGACVGHAFTNDLLARPNVVTIDDPDRYASELYRQAQRVDEWEGENYEGTSVLAGAKALQTAGYIGEYRWAFSIDDVIGALREVGPVIVGIPWTDGMYETRPSGLVEIDGRIVGGHAILLTGYHPGIRLRGEGWFARHEIVKWRNSWGRAYGRNGDGYVRVEDLARLLADRGEACVITQRFTWPHRRSGDA